MPLRALTEDELREQLEPVPRTPEMESALAPGLETARMEMPDRPKLVKDLYRRMQRTFPVTKGAAKHCEPICATFVLGKAFACNRTFGR